MARRAVPARVVAGGTSNRTTLAFERVAPLHAARTSQRDVPTRLNAYVLSSTVSRISLGTGRRGCDRALTRGWKPRQPAGRMPALRH